MALKLTFDICVTNGCTVFKLNETTGTYSVTNTTGWGSPNLPLGDVVSATMLITSPSGVEYTVDMLNTFNWPTNNSSLFANISASSLGLTNLEDGLWIFKYTVTDNSGNNISTTNHYLNYCNSECCVLQMLTNLKLDNCGCNCNDPKYEDYLKAWLQLEALKKAADCGDETAFNNIKKIVDKLCKNINCKTCK
jgi:hypothetical protein